MIVQIKLSKTKASLNLVKLSGNMVGYQKTMVLIHFRKQWPNKIKKMDIVIVVDGTLRTGVVMQNQQMIGVVITKMSIIGTTKVTKKDSFGNDMDAWENWLNDDSSPVASTKKTHSPQPTKKGD